MFRIIIIISNLHVYVYQEKFEEKLQDDSIQWIK